MGTKGNVIVGLGAGTVLIGAYGAVEGSSDPVGYTDGGVELSAAREYFESMVDQEIGVIEVFKIAERATLKLTLAETTLKNLAKAMDYESSSITTDLPFGGDNTVNELTIYLNVLGTSGASRKYTFHKCVIISAATHSYKKGEKTLIELEILVLQDTSKTTNQQLGSIVDVGGDTTNPTVIMTTPSPSGTVGVGTTEPIILTVTEANALNENTIIYGDTIQVLNETTNVLVAGTIVYNSGDPKTITFTPTSTWTSNDALLCVVSTGLEDVAGNALAATYVVDLSVST